MQRTLFFPLGHPEAVTEREIGHLAVAPERREGLTEGTDSVVLLLAAGVQSST